MNTTHTQGRNQLLQFLLGPKLVGAATLLLAAVLSARGKTGVALAADLLLAIVLACKSGEGRINGPTAETEHEVKGRLLGDVVIAERPAVLELLASKDQALLVRGNSLLVLDLLLHTLNGIRRLHIKGDGLARERLDEDLHLSVP